MNAEKKKTNKKGRQGKKNERGYVVVEKQEGNVCTRTIDGYEGKTKEK